MVMYFNFVNYSKNFTLHLNAFENLHYRPCGIGEDQKHFACEIKLGLPNRLQVQPKEYLDPVVIIQMSK